jgi:dolichol-phosphate mannosyltransferase
VQGIAGMTRAHNEQADDGSTATASPAVRDRDPDARRRGDRRRLLEACRNAALPLGPFEICVTNDGSRDDTGAALERFAAAHPDVPVTIVTHTRPAGQSAAVHDAVRAARAPLICTLDGDGQNPPEEIPNLSPRCWPRGPPPPRPRRWASGPSATIRWPSASPRARPTRSGGGFCATERATRAAGSRRFAATPTWRFPISTTCTATCPRSFQRDGWEVAHVDVTHRPREAGRRNTPIWAGRLSGSAI